MSFITISEFDNIDRLALVPITAPKAEQKVEINMTSTQSEPFQGKYIIISTPTPVGLAFGTDPEARVDFHVMRSERLYCVPVGSRLAVVMAEE